MMQDVCGNLAISTIHLAQSVEHRVSSLLSTIALLVVPKHCENVIAAAQVHQSVKISPFYLQSAVQCVPSAVYTPFVIHS